MKGDRYAACSCGWTGTFTEIIARSSQDRCPGCGREADLKEVSRKVSHKTILLVPSPEHEETLLRSGPCGAHPPVMLRGEGWSDPPEAWTEPAAWAPLIPRAKPERALVLACRGVAVLEGMAQAARVLAPLLGLDPIGGILIRLDDRRTWFMEDCHGVPAWLDDLPDAVRVLNPYELGLNPVLPLVLGNTCVAYGLGAVEHIEQENEE